MVAVQRVPVSSDLRPAAAAMTSTSTDALAQVSAAVVTSTSLGAEVGSMCAQHITQRQAAPQLLKPRPCPVPPSIVIPPPLVPLVDNSSAVSTTTSRLSPALALSPSDGGSSTSFASGLLAPTQPVDAMPFGSRLALPPDTWSFESPAASTSVFTSMLHAPHYVDVSFQQQSLALVPSPSSMSASLLTEPLVSADVQQSPSQPFAYMQPSPVGTQQQQSPSGCSSTLVPGPSSNSGAPLSPTAEMHLSMFSLSDVLLLGSSSSDSSALVLPQNSPLSVCKSSLAPSPSPSSSATTTIPSTNIGSGVKDITLNVLRPHFNKPMAVVAKELGVCITLLKKICRRNGLVRWPHRRIRSLVNRIAALQIAATSAPATEQLRLETQVATLCDELAAVIQNPNEKSRKAQADAKTRSPVAAPMVAPPSSSVEDAWTDDTATLEPPARTRKRAAPSAVPLNVLPPPIKIPRSKSRSSCGSNVRARRNSAPEQQHLRVLYDVAPALEQRPASTTSAHRKRGSISSILCDPAE